MIGAEQGLKKSKEGLQRLNNRRKGGKDEGGSSVNGKPTHMKT